MRRIARRTKPAKRKTWQQTYRGNVGPTSGLFHYLDRLEYYFFVYRDSWVCWTCRRAAGSPHLHHPTCPECRQPMEHWDERWRLPKRHDLKGWRKLQAYHEGRPRCLTIG